MKKVAFICPTYPKRYDMAKNLLESFKKYVSEQSDLFFVFSNKNDSNLFGEYEHKIVVPDNMVFSDKSSFVVGKKFFALDILKDKYQFLITLDDDSAFYQKVNLLYLCRLDKLILLLL